jgi:hypothetical protein
LFDHDQPMDNFGWHPNPGCGTPASGHVAGLRGDIEAAPVVPPLEPSGFGRLAAA